MSSDDLSNENAWQMLGDPISCDSDELIEVFSSTGLDESKCFYRVVVSRN